ncbi:MAG: aminotransferase class I/II-fold pyridoxal phosphate-dependent enzyme, partial [bacterium]
LDITEIAGFDDLNAPAGLFQELNRRLAALRGAERSFATVNGSTCGVLAALYACAGPGDRLLIARNAHKSVWHGAELCGAAVETLLPEPCGDFGFYGSLRLTHVPEGTAAVVVTSPTYEGVLSDVAALAALCHRAGVPLIVDAAHGAHLGYGGFPADALSQGADVVIESLHKTLPCLTQTAAVHIKSDLVDAEAVARGLALFQSSSPSYLLSAAIEGCVRWLEREGEREMAAWRGLLAETRRRLAPLLLTEGTPGIWGLDPSKLVFPSTDGRKLAALLRERGIEPELAAPSHLILMTGPGDTAERLARVADTLLSLAPLPPAPPLPPLPAPGRRVLPLRAAVRERREAVPTREAAGRISADYVTPYPPGIPLLTPGEEISEALAAFLAPEYPTVWCLA